MERHSEIQPQRTFRVGKYVFASDSFRTFRRGVELPGKWCTIPELVDRFPKQVTQQVVGSARPLPESRYHYSGTDRRYAGGVIEATTIPADSLLRIEDGRAFGRHGVIYGPDGTGVKEFDYEAKNLSTLARVLPGGKLNPRYWKHTLRAAWRARKLPAVRCWPGKVAALNAPGSENYFHWMLEILPRLHTLQKSGVVPDWYLIDAYAPFHLQTLRAFGVPLDRVIQPYSAMHVQAEELLVPSRNFPNSCREVGAELIRRIGAHSSSASSPRIFINRRGSRKPTNVEEFKRVLHQFGFEEHYLEDYSLARQIELFQHAESVVAMHGAGLANLVFCGPGTFVVELMPEGKYQPCYPVLSRLGNLRHHLITGKRTGFHQDILVPLKTIHALLADKMPKCQRYQAAIAQ